MNRLVMTMLTVALCALSTFAMPTKEQLKKAQPLVAELMAPLMATYKEAKSEQKAAAAAKVADSSAEFAKAAETEAAKFLLLKGAVTFYARGEQYDKAAETVTTLQREIKDVPPAVIAEITGKATAKISETTAPALYALYRSAKLQVRAGEEAKSLAAKLKKVKSDALQRKYAEALAVSGDWKSAYAEFAKVKNAKLQAIVKDESSGHAKNAESGEFWWAYEPAMEDAEDFFKSHAAAFYRKALAANEISGLKKNLIEQRIKEVKPEIAQTAVGEASSLPTTKSTTSAEVRQDAAPTASGKAWQEKGNTAWLTLPNGDKLEFAKCPAGTALFQINNTGARKRVKITRPFWIMTRPLAKRNFKTYAQYHPTWKGNDGLYDYPYGGRNQLTAVKAFAFAETLTEDFKESLPKGYVVRCPSLAELNYAINANSRSRKDPYSEFDNLHSEAAQKIYLKDPQGKSPKNNWGIHEFNRSELLLDKGTDSEVNKGGPGNWCVAAIVWKPEYAEDPLIWTEEAKCKHFARMFDLSHPSYLDQFMKLAGDGEAFVTDKEWGEFSCRLVVGPDLVSEWRAKHGKK